MKNVSKNTIALLKAKETIKRLRKQIANSKPPKRFYNGFTSWVETHHLIVAEVERIINNQEQDSWPMKIYSCQANGGMGGVWKLAEELTDRFELINKGRQWDGEYFDELEEFLTKELK